MCKRGASNNGYAVRILTRPTREKAHVQHTLTSLASPAHSTPLITEGLILPCRDGSPLLQVVGWQVRKK